jgi:hypothetical protein
MYLAKYTSLFTLMLPGFLACCMVKPDAPKSQSLCLTCTSEECQTFDSKEPLDEPTGGVFTRGDVDLTGDGVPEHVQFEGAQVTIHQDGVEVWRSPVSWDVVDVALGDPNDDGRNEILIVFWQQDETGQLQNQPFIIGYRGGYYRELWGGSPVGFPIHEVELADVDGDGRQEIIVLEAAQDAPDARTIAVWRWNQWWFSFVWRSEAGSYHDLQVRHNVAEDGTATVCVKVRESR